MAGLPTNAPARTDLVNATFVFKEGDDTKTGKLSLQKSAIDTEKIDDPQQFINDIADTQGITENDANRKDYATNNFIANGDSQKAAIEKFDVQMKTNRDDIDSNDVDIAQNATDIQAIEDSVGQPNGIASLDGNGDVPLAQLPQAAFDGLTPQGDWDANTNTPDLTTATPNNGDFYIVSVAGSTDLNGITTWNVNDWAIYTSSGWVRNISSEVTSVSGKTGAVLLDNTDVGLGNVTNDAQLKRSANDFSLFTEKLEPVEDDIVLIEDSEDSGFKKKAKLENLLGGGGGGSFLWELTEDISPIESTENGLSLLDFDFESEMAISAFVTVPENYKLGNQIQLLNALVVCASSSGNVLMRCETTLFKLGENPFTNVNTHISTNTELTLTASNELLAIGNIDLSDATGQINGVAVEPFDVLKIVLKRNNINETTSATDDARFLKYSSTVSFKP